MTPNRITNLSRWGRENKKASERLFSLTHYGPVQNQSATISICIMSVHAGQSTGTAIYSRGALHCELNTNYSLYGPRNPLILNNFISSVDMPQCWEYCVYIQYWWSWEILCSSSKKGFHNGEPNTKLDTKCR